MESDSVQPTTGSGQPQLQEEVGKNFYSGAAEYLYRGRGLTWDVVKEYPWTLTKNKALLDEAPYVTLYEYEIDESTIQTQTSYYSTAARNAADRNVDPLSPYENLFPRSKPINVYNFPYFSDTNFKLSTPTWQSLDTLEQGKKFVEGIGGVLGGPKGAELVGSLIEGTAAVAGAALAVAYPKVGIMDRPKLWQSHDFRTVEIKFYLFNTLGPNDWKKNWNLCWHLVNQNLFTKRDFITGIPPVYYEFIIPGQHYSFAASVTDLTIYNRGNMRRIEDRIVPDVYEVNMTLQDMVMPSRNLFQAIRNKQQQVTVNGFRSNAGIPITEPPVANTAPNTSSIQPGRQPTGPIGPVVSSNPTPTSRRAGEVTRV